MNQKEKILSKLKKQRITQKSIALHLNVSPMLISLVINGKSRSVKVEKVLTTLTGYRFPKNFKTRTDITELLQAK